MDFIKRIRNIYLNEESQEDQEFRHDAASLQAEFQVNRLIEESIRNMPPVKLSEAFTDQIMEQVDQLSDPGKFSFFSKKWFVYAGILVVIALGSLFLFNDYLLWIEPSLIDVFAGYIGLTLGLVLCILISFLVIFYFKKRNRQDSNKKEDSLLFLDMDMEDLLDDEQVDEDFFFLDENKKA